MCAWTSRESNQGRDLLRVDVHLHCLVTDGAFEEHAAEVPFLPGPPPTPSE